MSHPYHCPFYWNGHTYTGKLNLLQRVYLTNHYIWNWRKQVYAQQIQQLMFQ